MYTTRVESAHKCVHADMFLTLPLSSSSQQMYSGEWENPRSRIHHRLCQTTRMFHQVSSSLKLPVFQRSIWGSCHEKIQMLFSILSKKNNYKFTHSVDVYTSFLRSKTLIERNTGRNPQKVSAHILPYIHPYYSLFWPVLLSQEANVMPGCLVKVTDNKIFSQFQVFVMNTRTVCPDLLACQ